LHCGAPAANLVINLAERIQYTLETRGIPMSLIIELELERRLRARAQEEGVSVDAYLKRLMEDEVAGITQTRCIAARGCRERRLYRTD
jgi:hypothetical protein